MTSKILASIFLSITFGSALADTVPAEQAAKSGFTSCQKTVEKLAKHIIGDSENGALSTWHNKTSNSRIFNSQIILKYSDGNSVAILNVAPTKSGKCDGSYTRTFTHEKSCAVLRETLYKDWKFYGEIGGLVTLENSGGSVSTILLPFQTGCVTTQTEVVYE
jgi:hypothetical protein